MPRPQTLLLAAALAAPLALPPFAPAVAEDLTTVNVIMPLPRSANFYPLITGEALGYFAEEGVEVNLLPSSTSIPYVAFVLNGQADLAMLDPNETLAAVKSGANINVVYEVMQNVPEGIAVPADSKVQSVADLVGTTVGLVSDRDRAFLAMAMQSVGKSIDDVDTVVLGEAGPTLANAMKNNQVSAVSGAVPDWLSLQANGIKLRLFTPAELTKSPANTLSINVARIDELREPIEGFLRAWSKGMYVAKVDPEVTRAMAKAAVPEEWENEQFGQEFLDASIPMNLSTTEKAGDIQFDVWTAIQPRMVAVGTLDAPIDVKTFLNDSFIDAANDWSREEVAAEVKAWREQNM